MVVFDTARADAFEPYGAPSGASPAVRQFADSGRRYDAFSAAPWTIPSHATLFSGMLPRPAGIPRPDPENMSPDIRAALPPLRDRWLPSVLSEAGYDTAGISTNVQVSPLTGFDMGFNDFRYLSGSRYCTMNANSPKGRALWMLQTLRARVDDGAQQVEWLLNDWLANRKRRPFFWFANLIECHSPYLPPLPYNPLSLVGRLRAGQEARVHLHHSATWQASCGLFNIPPEALDRMRALYAAAIRLLDDWLGRILEAFDRHGLLDETIVVVTADHGENIGEGELIGHIFSLDDRLVRVPFMVSGPAAEIPGPLFSHVDFAGWIAQSVGLRDHPWTTPAQRRIAVAQFDAPGEPDDPRLEAAVTAWGIGELGVHRLTDTLTCATNGRLKLMRRADKDELYDLETDPLELSPMDPGPEAERRYGNDLAELRTALAQALAEASTPKAREKMPDLTADEMAELERRMRQLGYI
jgi:arylsulfatase A-like enzyme